MMMMMMVMVIMMLLLQLLLLLLLKLRPGFGILLCSQVMHIAFACSQQAASLACTHACHAHLPTPTRNAFYLSFMRTKTEKKTQKE